MAATLTAMIVEVTADLLAAAVTAHFMTMSAPDCPGRNRPVGGTTNVVQGTSQPRDDGGSNSTEALTNIVTMGLPAPAIPNAPVSSREELAMNQLINDMDMERRMTPPPFQPDPAVLADFQADLADEIAASNARLGRPVRINVTDGQAIPPLGDPYDEPQAGMVPLNSAPVPVPPPPRYQTNAQKDFYENLAAQGDAAMNQFRAEVRNLDNRGLLGSAIASGIGNDGVPNFDASFPAGSQIRGVTTTNFVDLPVVGTVPISTYTGLDNPNAPADTSSDDNDVVPPVANPMTGTSQCPDGYTFDEDLQACRRMTKRELQSDADSSTASGDMFYRRTSLDDAPANLPGGFNFADANRAFTQSYAFRPSFYRNPMDTTGFTKLL